MLKRKEAVINYYKKMLDQMISDVDFKRWLGEGCKIKKYSELKDYTTIYDLLPNEKDFVIILTEEKKNQGHWCCLLRNKDKFEWFDSYGVKPDGELKFIPLMVRRWLGQDEYDLSRLLEPVKYEYNKKKLQNLQDGINTCGKWCIARILMFQTGHTLDEFLEKCKEKKDETGKPYDILVCDWIKGA